MKKRPIFEKLVTRSTSVAGGETHEFFAEQLESRILYSAAPAPTPDSSVVVEATESQADAAFESIDSFKNAAVDRSQIQDKGSIETIRTLASFDDMELGEPVMFDSNPVAFKRWDAAFEVSEATGGDSDPVVDVEIVDIACYFGGEGRYEFDLDQDGQSRFAMAAVPANSHIVASGERVSTFGVGEFNPPTNILGMSYIQRSIEELTEFVA